MSHPRRHHSSETSPWKPQILKHYSMSAMPIVLSYTVFLITLYHDYTSYRFWVPCTSAVSLPIQFSRLNFLRLVSVTWFVCLLLSSAIPLPSLCLLQQ
jgi:hypothetical protein